MEMQLRTVSKEEAHRLIDEVEGDTVFILSYDKVIGLSENGKHIKKKKSKKIVSQSDEITLSENELTKMLNLYKESKESKWSGIFNRNSNIVKSILLPKIPKLE